jgi:hypothetical protein
MPFRIPMKTKKNCILYLVRSSQNDIDMLNKSLLLVSLNLIPAIKKKIDIIIFHEKSFDSNYQKKVEQPNECEVIFQEVNFILPDYDEEIKDQILTIYPHYFIHQKITSLLLNYQLMNLINSVKTLVLKNIW